MSKAPAAFFRVRDNFGLSDPIRILFKQCVNAPQPPLQTRSSTVQLKLRRHSVLNYILLCHIISTSSLQKFYCPLLHCYEFTFHKMTNKSKEMFLNPTYLSYSLFYSQIHLFSREVTMSLHRSNQITHNFILKINK